MAVSKLVAALALLGTITATSGISVVCKNDNTIAVTIVYSERAEILELSYGGCNLTSPGISGDTGISNNGWNLTFDISRCGMDSNLRTLDYNHTAKIIAGRRAGAHVLKLADFSMATHCSYTSEYNLTYRYDTESAPIAASTLPDVPEGDDPFGNITWKVASYNSNFTQEQEMTSQAGGMINLGFSVNSTVFSSSTDQPAAQGASIVLKSCEVRATDGSLSYTLFDTTAGLCSNDFIKLKTSYYKKGGFQMYQVQYILFMFGKTGSGGYELSCTTLICGSAGASACKEAQECLFSGADAS